MIENITKNQLSNMNDSDFEDNDEPKDGFNENEIDAYSFVEELKDEHIDLDNSDPKVFEGNIIDQKSKTYIKQYFSDYFKRNNINEFDVIDFSAFKLNNNQQFTKTLQYLETHKYAIIFQPTFIAKNKAIAKPDALINVDGKLFLVETKGTTKQISFVLTKNCSINKTGFLPNEDQKKELKNLTLTDTTHLKLLIRLGESNKSPEDTTIKSLLDHHPSFKGKKGYEEIYIEFLESSDKF